MRILFPLILACLAGCTSIPNKAPDTFVPVSARGQKAAGFAVAEGATGVGLSLAKGSVMISNPAVWVALAGVKVVATSWHEQLPEAEREQALHMNSAMWGGAAVCNLLMTTGVGGLGCVAGGLLSGVLLYNDNAPSAKSVKQIKYINTMDYIHQ